MRRDAFEATLVVKRLEGPVERAIDRIREATRAAHRDLDESLQIVRRLGAMDQRVRLLAGYHSLHRQTEAAIAPFLGEIAGLDFLARRRSILIAEGLCRLGQNTSPAEAASHRFHTRAEALGGFYVLEGSCLGGRVILKELNRRNVSLVGLDFLDPYGSRTGQRWKSFMAIFEQEIKSVEQTTDAITGALDTFAFAKSCLRKESAN